VQKSIQISDDGRLIRDFADVCGIVVSRSDSVSTVLRVRHCALNHPLEIVISHFARDQLTRVYVAQLGERFQESPRADGNDECTIIIQAVWTDSMM
jgi:hypothetical protein